MAKNSIRDFSATAASNTDIQSVDIDENCAASGINNAIRELMADIKDVSSGTVALETPQADGLTIGTSNLDMNGNELILDADADTSITADTDDQIDVKIGGADEYSFTATALDLNGNELVLDADGDSKIEAGTDDTINIVSGGTTALTVDASGRVLKPQVPFYYLRGGSAANVDMANADVFGSTNDGQAAFNTTGGYAGIRGFTYDSATGEINVPIDGLYHIGGNFYKNEDVGGVVGLYVNGGSVQFARAGVNQDSVNFALTLQLSANDKITYINASGTDRIFYEGAQHTSVFGHLVG